ncbi:MAG: hypothetical protein KatS3mg046_013 [Bellilinea sp.]|nr:MAG: hypothetical protein KatS3mg046_013 [Bellilinea sp.]
MSPKNPRLLTILDTIFLILVVGAAGYFRFVNLGQNPGLYNDEGTLLNLSINHYNGRMEYLGIEGSWLLAGRMPVFPWLLSLAYHFFEPGLLVLRTFTALSGVISVLLLFLFLRNVKNEIVPYLEYISPLVLAIHPKLVLFNRIGFGYNLLIPITIIVIWLLWLYLHSKKTHWLILASLIAGTGVLIELAYIVFVVFVAIVIAIFNIRKFPFTTIILLLPLMIYFIISFLSFGDAFLFDWQVTFGRGNAATFLYQIGNLIIKIILFMIDDPTFLISIFGVLALSNPKLSFLFFFGIFIPLIIISRTFSMTHQSYYYFLPYVPFVAVGIASFIIQFSKWIMNFSTGLIPLIPFFQKLSQRTQNLLKIIIFDVIFFTIIILPSSLFIFVTTTQVKEGFRTNFDHLLINIQDFSQINHYLQKEANPTDLIIASPAIAWALPGNPTDYQIAIAVNESPTIHFPKGIPKERMRFETSIQNADYAIVDKIMKTWTNGELPGIEDWVKRIEAEWQPVFQTDSMTIYRKPRS